MMKHRHLVMGSVLILNLGLGGCTWDSSLYDTYVHDDSLTRCPPGDLLTDDNGEKYIDLNTIKCYKDEMKFKSEGGESNPKPQCVLSNDGEKDCSEIKDFLICEKYQQQTSEIFDKGSMPKIAFIQDLLEPTSLKSLDDYPEASEYRICPSAYNICAYSETDFVFGCVNACSKECPLLGCMNSDNMCGKDCVNCNEKGDVPNASSYKCNKFGVCTVKDCNKNHHLKRVKSEENDQLNHQSVDIDQYVCEENTDNLCGAVDSVETSDCSEFDANAESSSCRHNGYCTVTECKVGYHLTKGEKEEQYTCEKNTDEACGEVNKEAVPCSEFDANAAKYRCHENGYCTVDECQSGYHLTKGEKDNQKACEENRDEACGPVDGKAVNCSDATHDTNASIYRCNKDGACTVKVCNVGYHLKSVGDDQDDQYACEKNTDKSCGPVDSVKTSDCSEHAEEYRCHDNGYCTVTKCKVDYHLKKGEKEDQYACEENTAELCGAVDSYVTYSCKDVVYSTKECNLDGLCVCESNISTDVCSPKSATDNCSALPIAGKDRRPYCVPEVWCGTGLDKIACHDQPGWLTGICKDLNDCEAETCQEGYQNPPPNGECVPIQEEEP